LPRADYEALAQHITDVAVPHRQIIATRRQPLQHIYFPRGAVLSILVTMDDGQAVEGATIGHEGMLGLAAFLGDGTSIEDVVCQVSGREARIDVPEFQAACERSESLHEVLHRYSLALMGQMSRTAGCNRVHPVEERLARWLLMTHDRVGADTFFLTHEFLAAMLGVRRPSVTVAAGLLQRAGLIDYLRGNLRILDRPRLEETACEDYRLTGEIYEGLFPDAEAVGSSLTGEIYEGLFRDAEAVGSSG
jgi:CRP-like cAMP-binding protein